MNTNSYNPPHVLLGVNVYSGKPGVDPDGLLVSIIPSCSLSNDCRRAIVRLTLAGDRVVRHSTVPPSGSSTSPAVVPISQFSSQVKTPRTSSRVYAMSRKKQSRYTEHNRSKINHLSNDPSERKRNRDRKHNVIARPIRYANKNRRGS